MCYLLNVGSKLNQTFFTFNLKNTTFVCECVWERKREIPLKQSVLYCTCVSLLAQQVFRLLTMFLIPCRLICLFILFLKGGESDCLLLKKVNQLNQGSLHLFCKMCGISFSCILLHTHPHIQLGKKIHLVICLFKPLLHGLACVMCIMIGNCPQKTK